MRSHKICLFLSSTLCILLCILSAYIIESKASPTIETTYTSSVDIYNKIISCYNGGTYGPMLTIKGNLTSTKESKEVYWIFLGGYETVENQPTNLESTILSAFELTNIYEVAIESNIDKYIPYNSNLILCGHSLGGMIAQQLANNSNIKNHYNVLYTLTYGSPLMNPIKREGKLKRYVDTFDPIPYLSITNMAIAKFYKCTENRGTSSYPIPNEAHFYSYSDYDTWGKYDVLGNKNGNVTFTFTEDNVTYYKCPTIK